MSTGSDGPPDQAGTIRPRVGAWPQSKLARAQTHFVELQSRVNAWLATEPFEVVSEIAEDRLSWRLRLALKQQPPTVEWSTIAGDCIHNLRSALDAAVWEFATLDSATPPRPKDLYFPIEVDSTGWDKVVSRKLAGVPRVYVERIEAVQPFNHAEGTRRPSALPLIHALDIDDKHRAGVTALVRLSGAEHHASIEFESDDAGARNSPPQTSVRSHEIADGAILLEQFTADPIRKVSGDFQATLRLGLATAEYGAVPLLETLGTLNQATANTLSNLYRAAGAAAPDQPEIQVVDTEQGSARNTQDRAHTRQ